MTDLTWERYPLVSNYPLGKSWLILLSNLGRADATLDAYARALNKYLGFCLQIDVNAETATLEHVSLYVRYLAAILTIKILFSVVQILRCTSTLRQFAYGTTI